MMLMLSHTVGVNIVRVGYHFEIVALLHFTFIANSLSFYLGLLYDLKSPGPRGYKTFSSQLS